MAVLTGLIGALSAFYHDSAAALIVDGKIVAAAQEERFTRVKHDQRFPAASIGYVLDEAELGLDSVDHVIFYDKPFLKFERLLETYLAFAPRGFKSFSMAMPVWLREKLFLRSTLTKKFRDIHPEFDGECLRFSEHHFSHAASAYFPSPYEEAVVLTIDGVGEWATSSVAIGRGNTLDIVKEIHFPHSLGLLYSAFTYYLGFKVNSGEYKVMGLAPYGRPSFKNLILEYLIDLKEDGSFRLDQSFFNYATGLEMTARKFTDLFGAPRRSPESDTLTQFHMDVAASIQAVTEDILLTMTRALAQEYQIPNLCLAGGVALNCVANGKVLRDQAFKNVWIQPAAGDAGGALGAALAYWHCELDQPRSGKEGDQMSGAFLGPAFNQVDVEASLAASGACFEVLQDDDLISATAQALSSGQVVGWFQGRMEFGPRALGNRSILADPRSESMQRTLNMKIKFREGFRPFAPAILYDHVGDWFDIDRASPYMLIVGHVVKHRQRPLSDREKSLVGLDMLRTKRSEIPAVTHVDNSARIQTVTESGNSRFYALLREFYKLSGCPVLANTSFNVRGEPIVHSPEDAFRCFMGTDMDMLVVGNCLLDKNRQRDDLKHQYAGEYEHD